MVLDGSYNLTEANYKTSLQNMVDRVLITDKDGNQIGVVEDTAAQQKYGVVQTVYKQEDGKDAQTEAKALLQTLEQTGSVTGCQGDSRAVSGYALIVQETTTGLFGKFYIESDTHTFTDGKHEMALTLAFSNMMDEKRLKTNPKDRRQEICQDGRWRWPRPCAATAPGEQTAAGGLQPSTPPAR